jgi:hypothetical protein
MFDPSSFYDFKSYCSLDKIMVKNLHNIKGKDNLIGIRTFSVG